MEERDGAGALQATYVNGGGIDRYVTQSRGGSEYWTVQSPLNGSVGALVDSAGAIICIVRGRGFV